MQCLDLKEEQMTKAFSSKVYKWECYLVAGRPVRIAHLNYMHEGP